MGDLLTTSGQVPEDLRAAYAEHGQEQVFEYVDSGVVTTADEIDAFVAQLRSIDLPRLRDLYKSTDSPAAPDASSSPEDPSLEEMKPIDSFGSLDSAPAEDKDRWFKTCLLYTSPSPRDS